MTHFNNTENKLKNGGLPESGMQSEGQPTVYKNRNWLQRNIGQIFLHVVVLILMVCVLYPMVLLILDSFKTKDQFQFDPFGFPSPAIFDNYKVAWLYVKDFMINSVVVTVMVTVILVAIATVTAYAFTRFNFRFKETLFIAMLALMMIPGMLTLISQYGMIVKFNMLNDYWAAVLPSVSGSIPMSVFLFRTFFSGVPKELFEAAEIDGASQPRQLVSIMMPMSKAIIATLTITTVLSTWNDYLWPLLVFPNDIMKTIPVGLVSWTDTYYKMVHSYGPPFAGYVIASIPLVIVFSIASKQFIAGLTSGAFKM